MHHVGFVELGEDAGINEPISVTYDTENGQYYVSDDATSRAYALDLAGQVPMQGASLELLTSTSLYPRGIAAARCRRNQTGSGTHIGSAPPAVR